MSGIYLNNICKTFKVPIRKAGLINAAKGVLKREYRICQALENISFNIAPGELVGYIGPNGAGKSTTVKIMSGIMVPDSGECSIMNRIPWKNRKAHVAGIGVVFGQRSQLWWDVPVTDSFELLKDIYRVDDYSYKKNRNELIERLDLADLLNVPVRQLSLGQKMRCEFAASLLHSPSILFLDEPTIGLDAVSKIKMREFIRDINRDRGITVILTTHDMDDIEALCRRVMVIGKGKILYDGNIAGLRREADMDRRMCIDFFEDVTVFSAEDAIVESIQGNQVILSYKSCDTTATRLLSTISSSYEIRDVTVENIPIEKIIARLYEVYSL